MAAEANSETNAYIFQWKLENVCNWWWLKNGEGIESPVFIADGLQETKWTLWFYPIAETNPDFAEFYLQREDDCNGPVVVEIFYTFVLLNIDGSVSKEINGPLTRFRKGNNRGFEERERILYLEREKLLLEDSLNVQCTVWMPNPNIVKPSPWLATSSIKVKRRCLVWRINNPQKLECDVRNKFKDYLIICNLLLNKTLDKLRVSLSFLDDNIRYASCNISIINAEGRKENCSLQKCFASDLSEEPLIFKLELLSKRLLQNQDLYYPNDTLSLDFEFVMLTVENCFQSENVIVGNEKVEKTTDLVEDIYSLFSDRILSDTEIRTSTKKYSAHRNILSARSPVFLRMFNQDMQESISGVVEIPDYDEETVCQMLTYIYSGSVKNLQNFESAVNLYKIADKYEILSLRNYCSSFLTKNLNPTNACDTLVLADLYSDNDLKGNVQDYILRQRKQIFYSQEWENFMKDHLKLAADVMFMKLTKSRSNLLSAT